MARDRNRPQSANNDFDSDRQCKVEMLHRDWPSDPSYLRSNRLQFSLRASLITTTLACVLFAALATRHSAVGALVGLGVLVTYGFVEGWFMSIIEQWIGDE